ncbi:hypothetical protein OPV22_000489 [Ensete ventricosum]|uniref:NAC domain-containing protein n=1 Tax=Ensete ventricosum TaxID=4639 RepID=A0AAV8RUR1_ENSVE|nr:hypothetical protein OPV22_000489 [Ensete ventricosum]
MRGDGGGGDGHEHDVVMPGFRFHPTEEELIEFYLRRKVEGKRFNVELITFLDLYHYDPWELPALAAMGEKEWFFYVPRDRKYRNGDRPNRVTASGYWKATGADRMIRDEGNRSIGLKKTLVFYSGKAPKGIRSSWIMNEYRLPRSDTEQHKKAEISICRVYKRAGVEGHHRLPLASKPSWSSSRGTGTDRRHNSCCHQQRPDLHLGGDSSWSAAALSTASAANSLSSTTSTDEDGTSARMIDELNRLVGFNQNYVNYNPNLLPFTALPISFPAVSDKLWEWNSLHETGRESGTGFK